MILMKLLRRLLDSRRPAKRLAAAGRMRGLPLPARLKGREIAK